VCGEPDEVFLASPRRAKPTTVFHRLCTPYFDLNRQAATTPDKRCRKSPEVRGQFSILYGRAAARNTMSNKPTATAVSGKFQSKDGSDLVQYLNSRGQVVLWVDADGVLRINTTAAQGAVLQMGLPSDD
jgi:hypothetical protein